MTNEQGNTELEQGNSTQGTDKKPHGIRIGDRVRVVGGIFDRDIGVVTNVDFLNEVEVSLMNGRSLIGYPGDFEVYIPEIDVLALQRQLCDLRVKIDESSSRDSKENIEIALGKIMRDFFDIRWEPPHKGRWWPRGFEG